jgi:hypothetical protein
MIVIISPTHACVGEIITTKCRTFVDLMQDMCESDAGHV